MCASSRARSRCGSTVDWRRASSNSAALRKLPICPARVDIDMRETEAAQIRSDAGGLNHPTATESRYQMSRVLGRIVELSVNKMSNDSGEPGRALRRVLAGIPESWARHAPRELINLRLPDASAGTPLQMGISE